MSHKSLKLFTFLGHPVDHNNNQFNWLSKASSIIEEDALDITDSYEKIKFTIKLTYNDSLKQNVIKKLRTYPKFKTAVRFENYLDLVTDFKIRRCFKRFLLRVYDLEIEKGHYGRKTCKEGANFVLPG